MKIEQLMDSINEINDVYISEVDELRLHIPPQLSTDSENT